MKKVFSALRILGLTALAIIIAEVTLETGEKSSFETYPVLWLILAVVVLIALAIEASIAALERTLYNSLKPEAREKFDAAIAQKKAEKSWWR